VEQTHFPYEFCCFTCLLASVLIYCRHKSIKKQISNLHYRYYTVRTRKVHKIIYTQYRKTFRIKVVDLSKEKNITSADNFLDEPPFQKFH
jgi:hypothetical protein